MSNKYEQLVEFIINDETDKARELFHQIVVEKSRDIYESLVDESDLDEVIGGNEVEGLVKDVQMDEEGISEEEEFGDEEAEDSEEEDGAFDHEEGHEEAGEEELEDRVVDLESALDELKAEFDALMAGEEHEEEQFPGIHGDEGHEEVGGEEEDMMYEAKEEDDEEEELDESKEEDDEEDEEDLEESKIVKEYVDNVGTPYKGDSVGAEGKLVGNDGRRPINAKTPVAGKNDMGGSAKNIASGKANANPDGNTPAKEGASNAYKKGEGKLPHNGQFKNVPGSKKVWDGGADKQPVKKENETGKLAGNDGSRPIQKTSVIKSTPR
jgi:hypothetical protein